MGKSISVILCSRNPRQDFLKRVLEGLNNQDFPHKEWELIIVDSASSTSLEETLDLDTQFSVRFCREEYPGYITARIRGIKEAVGELLVFVDDDNVLAPDYLKEAHRLASGFKRLGIWGGSVFPEYESPPPDWIRPYEYLLSVRTITRDSWTNLPHMQAPWIIGAGMVVRKHLAMNYATLVASDFWRLELDRNPDHIRGAEDIDLMLAVCDQGYGRGVFKALHLTHLIPVKRCTLQYLSSIAKDNFASMEIIRHCRGERKKSIKSGAIMKLWQWLKICHLPLTMRTIIKAEEEGKRLADHIINQCFSLRKDSLYQSQSLEAHVKPIAQMQGPHG